MGTSQLDKLKKLCVAAGIRDIDMDGKFVAIKMHFGELGNLAFLRPNYAKAVADLCKEQGGLPFLTDPVFWFHISVIFNFLSISYFTVTLHFAVNFPAFTVITAVPFFFAVILPLESTVAMLLLLVV